MAWRQTIRSLLSSSLLAYGAVTVAAAAVTLLAVPLLIALLGMEAYGRWTLIEAALFFATAFVLVGIDHGAIKQVAHDGRSVPEVAGALLPVAAAVALLAGGVTFLLARAYFGDTLAALLALSAIAEAFLVLTIAIARAGRLTLLFAIGQIGRSALFLVVLGAALAFGWAVLASLEGALAARLILLAGVAGLLVLAIRPALRWSPPDWSDASRYGSFILVTSLLALVIENADRFIIEANAGSAMVGAYVAHVKLIALIGQAIVTPFMLWFPAERFVHLRDADGGSRFFSRAATGMFVTMIWASCGLYLVAPFLLALIAPGVEFNAIVFFWLLAGGVFGAMGYAVNIGLLKPGLTHLNLVAAAFGAAAALLAEFMLTPLYGVGGTAAGRALGLGVYTLGLWLLSQRHHRVAWDYAAMLGAGAVLVAICAAMMLVLPGGGWFDPVRALAFGVAGLPVLLLLARIRSIAS